ncbi:unnamed protein product [Periconia digitata]|uniref:Uncharacterized protein n=1 Tax=Periconia digitata TaxID=1303443 RepID=A0A9W4UVM7_9PLEO|nr:unnamed protein product [Periconia digitata]
MSSHNSDAGPSSQGARQGGASAAAAPLGAHEGLQGASQPAIHAAPHVSSQAATQQPIPSHWPPSPWNPPGGLPPRSSFGFFPPPPWNGPVVPAVLPSQQPAQDLPQEPLLDALDGPVMKFEEINLINADVLDAIDAAGSTPVPHTFLKVSVQIDGRWMPVTYPNLSVCGRPRLTGNLDGRTPIAMVSANWDATPDERAQSSTPQRFMIFTMQTEQPRDSQEESTVPPPLSSPIMVQRVWVDLSLPAEEQKWIEKDKPCAQIIMEILRRVDAPPIDGFDRRGMTVIPLQVVFDIMGDGGEDHFVYNHRIRRAVLADDSMLLESGYELGCPNVVMKWLGGAVDGERILPPTSLLRNRLPHAIGKQLARIKVQQAPMFATQEEKDLAAETACGEPEVVISLWKGEKTFPMWVWTAICGDYECNQLGYFKPDFKVNFNWNPDTTGIWGTNTTHQTPLPF